MMFKLKKTTSQRHPAGMEWIILKKLPRITIGATVVPLMMSGIARLLPLQSETMSVAKQISRIDIFSIAIAITAWTAVFTVAIGCVIVIIMKGPRYEADSYPLNESERPRGKSNNRKSNNS